MAAGRQWRTAVEHADIIEAEKPAFKKAPAKAVLAIDPPAEICGEPAEHPLPGVARDRLPKDDPARQWSGIREPGTRSVGLHARCHARLQPAWQADRQCLHRKPERQVPRRVPERELVPQPRRGAPKMRGLA